MGGFFWQVNETLAGFQNRLGFIFFTLAIFGFASISSLEVSSFSSFFSFLPSLFFSQFSHFRPLLLNA